MQCKTRYVTLLQALSGAQSKAGQAEPAPAALHAPAPPPGSTAAMAVSQSMGMPAGTKFPNQLLGSIRAPAEPRLAPVGVQGTAAGELLADLQPLQLPQRAEPAVAATGTGTTMPAFSAQPGSSAMGSDYTFVAGGAAAAAAAPPDAQRLVAQPLVQRAVLFSVPGSGVLPRSGYQDVAVPPATQATLPAPQTAVSVLSGISVRQQLGGLVAGAGTQCVTAAVQAAAAADLPPPQLQLQQPTASQMVASVQVRANTRVTLNSRVSVLDYILKPCACTRFVLQNRGGVSTDLSRYQSWTTLK